MKITDLYIRVSTDDQADNGYSQRNQEEVLRKYCKINNIQIREVVYEDHSAKSFNRPEWKKLITLLKRYKNKTDLILFTKWDRFSRNTGDAYQMISQLRKLGVEPQAIEQPLDLSVPENKLMLAFYLAAPEVENDRRALNVFVGMRRAKKEGRYMGTPPAGYKNRTSEEGIKYIKKVEPEASIMKWAFEEIAQEKYNTLQIFKTAQKKGLKISKSSFWRAIVNPLYCGKIFIPKYKEEPSALIKGLHEPIITEELYYKVQEALDARRKNYRPKIEVIDDFPLRGFLMCPKCEKLLTASKSKGRNKYYAYYHCTDGCSHRVRAEIPNEEMGYKLQQFIPKENCKELYKIIITEEFYRQTGNSANEKKKIHESIKDYQKRLSYTRDLLATQQIDASDYKNIKSDYEEVISKLEGKLSEFINTSNDLESLLNEGIDRLLQLNYSYEKGDLKGIRDLIGSIFPENLTFEENSFRTTRINDVAKFIYLINSELGENKNGKKNIKNSFSREVDPQGFEPRQTVPKTGVLPLHHGSCF